MPIPLLAFTPPPQRRSVEWEDRVLFTLNMAALHPKARPNASSPTTTTPNVVATEECTNPMLRENQTTATTDTASDPLRDTIDADVVGSVAGLGQDVKTDTVRGNVSASTAVDGAAAAAAAEIDPPTSRDGPTPDGRASKGDDTGRGECVESDCRDKGLTSDLGTPRRVACGHDMDGPPAAKEGDNEGQAQPAPPKAAFVLVAKEHLVGTWLAVFVRASMLTQVSDVRSGKAWTGLYEHLNVPSLGGSEGFGGYVQRRGMSAFPLTGKLGLACYRRFTYTISSHMVVCSVPKRDRCYFFATIRDGTVFRPLP